MNNSYQMAVRNPILQAPAYQHSPDTTRLTLEQEYNRLSNRMSPQGQSTVYTDYVNTLNSCSDITRERILNDERFSGVYSQCEAFLKEYLYSQALPYVLETQQGRIGFEQLLTITKALKDEYTQRDVQKERQLELLMQDEVVLKRLQELQNEKPITPTEATTNNKPNKHTNKNNPWPSQQKASQNEVTE